MCHPTSATNWCSISLSPSSSSGCAQNEDLIRIDFLCEFHARSILSTLICQRSLLHTRVRKNVNPTKRVGILNDFKLYTAANLSPPPPIAFQLSFPPFRFPQFPVIRHVAFDSHTNQFGDTLQSLLHLWRFSLRLGWPLTSHIRIPIFLW